METSGQNKWAKQMGKMKYFPKLTNIGEKPTVILYTYINRHAGTPEKQRKQKHCSISSNMVVIIYCYIGCEDEVTT